MGPSVPQESQQLVCVCANEFAQTLPIYTDASAPRRTTAAKLLSKDEARRIARFATLNLKRIRAVRKRLTQSRWSRLIPLAGALALMTTYASAQASRTRQHILTPEEKQIDNDYKAATSKIPDQKPNDPWGALRPAPSTPSPKTPTGAGAKKTQQ
jgi:hypothetical protein